jgi:hypothetical protein
MYRLLEVVTDPGVSMNNLGGKGLELASLIEILPALDAPT